MYYKKILVIFSFVLMVFACETENNPNIENSSKLLGTWVYLETIDSITTYTKTDNIGNNYGFEIKDESIFIERKNSGWCGTPPISYSDFNGNWSLEDSTVHISVDFWGGTSEYIWKIISLDDTQLSIFWHSQNYEYQQH